MLPGSRMAVLLPILVFSFITSSLAGAQIGFNLMVSARNTKPGRFASASLGGNRVLVCSCSSCEILEVEGAIVRQITAKLEFDSSGTEQVALATLRPSQAVLCLSLVDVAIRCSVLVLNGTQVTRGESMVVHTGASSDPAMALLSDGLILLCFRDNSRSDKEGYGRCAGLSSDIEGSFLQYEGAVVANAASSDHLTLTRLENNKALFCYTSCIQACKATCKILAAAGNAIMVGPASVLSIGFAHTGFALTSLDASRAVACYHDSEQNGTAQCNVLTMDGTAVDVGPKQTLTLGSTYNIVVGRVSADYVLACYNWEDATSQCHTVKITGTNISSVDSLDGGQIFMHLVINALPTGHLLSCFSDLLEDGVAKCRTIQSSYAVVDATTIMQTSTLEDVHSSTSTVHTSTSTHTTTVLRDTGKILPAVISTTAKAPVRCAVLNSPHDQYVTDECGNALPGDVCLVKCNYDDGWIGSPARFFCEFGNIDPKQPPLAVVDWPSCSRTWSGHVALWAGAGGGVLAMISCIAVFFCPGGVRDCMRSSERHGAQGTGEFSNSRSSTTESQTLHQWSHSAFASNSTSQASTGNGLCVREQGSRALSEGTSFVGGSRMWSPRPISPRLDPIPQVSVNLETSCGDKQAGAATSCPDADGANNCV